MYSLLVPPPKVMGVSRFGLLRNFAPLLATFALSLLNSTFSMVMNGDCWSSSSIPCFDSCSLCFMHLAMTMWMSLTNGGVRRLLSSPLIWRRGAGSFFVMPTVVLDQCALLLSVDMDENPRTYAEPGSTSGCYIMMFGFHKHLIHPILDHMDSSFPRRRTIGLHWAFP